MINIIERPVVLVATLGNNPQVVTLALDKLIEKYRFAEVCVIHTAVVENTDNLHQKLGIQPKTLQNLDSQFQNLKLLEETSGDKLWRADYRVDNRYYQFRYRRVLIQQEVERSGDLPIYEPVSDVETEANSQAAFRTIFRVVKRYKEQRAIIHFNLAGGRKSMSVFAMSAAQMLFAPGDQLWHVMSGAAFMNSGAMHDDGTSTRLVPIPYVSVTSLHPALGMLIASNDPYDILQAQENYLHLMDLQRKEKFLRTLDFDEYQILMGVAQGLNNAEIGSRLKKSLAAQTVANKLTTIYETYLVAIAEGVTAVARPESDNMRAFLAAEFGAYFQQRNEKLT